MHAKIKLIYILNEYSPKTTMSDLSDEGLCISCIDKSVSDITCKEKHKILCDDCLQKWYKECSKTLSEATCPICSVDILDPKRSSYKLSIGIEDPNIISFMNDMDDYFSRLRQQFITNITLLQTQNEQHLPTKPLFHPRWVSTPPHRQENVDVNGSNLCQQTHEEVMSQPPNESNLPEGSSQSLGIPSYRGVRWY
jgi:hypothetical protein